MTLTLYAQPYDMSATGFYFVSAGGFGRKAQALRNTYGASVEEFEIQVIDGELIDIELANAIGINQANLAQALSCVEDWDDDQKTRVIMAVGECGYIFDASTDPDSFDVDVYPGFSLRRLAEHFVDEGLFGDIPERLEFYIDYDAIARDLAMEYSEAEIAGERLIYRCG